MNMTDPIADMLTRIRNAVQARHDYVQIPASKMKLSIAQVLKDEGYIKDFQVIEDSSKKGAKAPLRLIRVQLNYSGKREPVLTGIKRVSKPGLRVYVQKREIPRVFGGLGVAILSTPQGIMTGPEARRRNVGGEVLCYVW
jgi:small subunit ribosomal protein S8